MNKIFILDSTLRDGAQGEGITFSPEDKLDIVKALDKLGVDYIEAGNPHSNPKDMEFFAQVAKLELKNSKIVAFGATRRHSTTPQEDKGCQSLLASGAQALCIVGKASDTQVTKVLGTSPEENLAMIADTMSYFAGQGREVMFDAEHFFDGYKQNPDYALRAVMAAAAAGAKWVVLCDTNGGSFPEEICNITKIVKQALPKGVGVGIHCHNDNGCAVAGSLAAVEGGATQVQGTYVGFGERCGNANLSTVIANLQIKKGYNCIDPGRMKLLTKTAQRIAQVANLMLPGAMPYVGKSAFAHKGGMHVDGVSKSTDSFEHISPDEVGNSRNLLLSEVSGRTAVAARMNKIDDTITRDSAEAVEFIEVLKQKEAEGYQFESADASLELLALKHLGRYRPLFELEYFKVLGEQPAAQLERSASAMVKISVQGRCEMTAAEGDGPIHALDLALRQALEVFYPSLKEMRLIDFKVRVMESSSATAAAVRVLIVSSDHSTTWTTVGVSADLIDASWQALRDSIEYKLTRDGTVAE